MARMKYPGTNKARCAPKKKKNFTMSGRIKQKQFGEKLKSSFKKPVCISLRKYREIFGDSDEEEEEFYGFRAEDLGLKAYRSFSVKDYLDGNERISYRKDGARDRLSRHLSGNVPKILKAESPQHKSNANEAENKPPAASPSQNVYAKLYKKRDSYERRFARPAQEFDKAYLSANVKSTTKVKANFVPRVQKTLVSEGINHHSSPNLHESNLARFHMKKKAVPLARQLLAKAKEGQRIRKQRKFDAVNKEGQPVRSRSGRVVKSKKLDYDDVTSPKFKVRRDEGSMTGSSNYVNRVARKRRSEDGEVPPNKAFRTAKVKLEKVELPGDQRVYVNNPASPTGFEIQPLSSTGVQSSRFRFKDVPSQESLPNNVPQSSSYCKKVRIKNATRIKNGRNERNHYQPAKFTNHGIQRVKNSRTSNLLQNLKLHRPAKGHLIDKEICGKRSERIKTKKQNDELPSLKSREEEMDDQASNASSLSEVSTTNSDVISRKTPSSANKHLFKSKRLQELQEKIESGTKEDVYMEEETACNAAEMQRHSKEENEVGVEPDTERKSRPRSRQSSQEGGRCFADERPASEKPVLGKQKRACAKKTQLSRLQALRNDGELPSSSDDEESSKPLSQVKKELKKGQLEKKQEPTERVVKKVIKVVKKIRTKSGETKTKVVKIIKKIGVRKKEDTDVSLVPGRRRIRCGQCKGCKVLDDCGVCRWCIDKPKFGGPGTSKQSCVERKCINPQPPKPKGAPSRKLVKDSNATVKKKPPTKNELKVKGSKKGQNQASSSTTKKPVASVKPPPCGKRQAVVADIPLVKLPWSDNSTEEEIWKEGFAICFTAGVPTVVKELCFLCGSKGSEKMFYCRVCSEPFHGFCLDEEPLDETTWCCDNCSSCSVCGYQDKLLMCDRCQRGYHVECLGPFYPTEPEGDDDVWVCGRCVQCKNCGRRTAGDNPEAVWMLEFTHCQECGKQRQQNNFCPLCDKCYSDDDFESKMVHCVKCDHWVHAECQGITVDQYECLTDLPEDVQFVCRRCCEDQVSSPWYKELMEEMEAGYERIVEEIKSCKAYEPLKSHFEQLEADNGHPKDFEVISAKVKDRKYTSVEMFCDDITKVLERIYRPVETDSVLTKHWSSLYYTFCKELAAMFPWHKLKSKVNSEEHKENVQPILKNGIVGPTIPYEVWDHSYVSVKSSQEKFDSTRDGKSQPSSSKALQMNSLENENGEVQEMETDVERVLQEEKVANEEPMETDYSTEEQQQLKQLQQQKQEQQPQQESNVEDTRKCLLCGLLRDAEPTEAGRLLTCGLDEWVHVNCGLWSAEVFEDDEGRLQNVQVAISRGKQMKCEHCGEVGATVGCCEPRCPMNYHFMCARNAKAEFQDDKKVYCAQHSFRTKKELVMVNDDFCVERRVCVDMGKIRATKKSSRGFEPHSINLVQGSLTLENMGKLNEHSDTEQTLYPINFRISRLYWSVNDPTKRCRYYCTMKEKKIESTQRIQQEAIKDSIDQEHLHKVISHEEVNKKDKVPKIMSTAHGDFKNSAQPRQSNRATDYLNSSYGKKLKRIAPHPGPGIVNHSIFPGVLLNDTTHLSKLRRILPAPQKPLPASPTNSPRKLIEHINRQTSHLPSILNPVRVEKSPSPVAASAPAQKAVPQRSRKTPPAVKRTMNFEESIPQTVRQLNCDHEVVAKAGDEELLNSPIKEISPKSWLVKLRERESAAQSEKPNVSFEITSDEGVRVEANTCEAAWKQVFEKVQEARIDRHMKLVPFAGVNGKAMFGVRQESVVSMLEQMPGAHQLKQYSFKYNPPFDNSSLEETQALKENPHGCARAEVFHRNKKYDMFAFLASTHRVPPQLEESAEEQESAEQARDGPLSVRRPTCLDLPMAMRYRHLKQCSFNKDAVAVYRSPIHGRGLFCTRNIAAGEMVIEYSGMLVRSVLTDKREKYYESKGIGCYMFRVDGTYVVDATMCGNAARFINHSCESNCFSRVITVDGQKKIIIFASKSTGQSILKITYPTLKGEGISRGEELTYDYKFPIEDEKLPCLCHSKHCRKYLN